MVNHPVLEKTSITEPNQQFLLLGDKQGRREYHSVSFPPSLFNKTLFCVSTIITVCGMEYGLECGIE